MIAKTLLKIFAMVLVVACFNAPTFGGGPIGPNGGHPWENDGSNPQGGGGIIPIIDTTGTGTNHAYEPGGGTGDVTILTCPGSLFGVRQIIIIRENISSGSRKYRNDDFRSSSNMR